MTTPQASLAIKELTEWVFEEMKKLCIFCGARPNFTKVAPVIRAINRLSEENSSHKVSYSLVYAGSENDPTLEDQLSNSLSTRRPDVYLSVEYENLSKLTGRVMSKFKKYLQENPSDVAIIMDDLASTVVAVIVIKKQATTFAHIAAGTRSFDITMPKEIDHLVTDGLSDILFTAGLGNNSVANREKAELSKAYMVDNILIDNIRYDRERIEDMRFLDIDGLVGLPLKEDSHLVFTLNRKALLVDQDNLGRMLHVLSETAGGTPIIVPLCDSAMQVIMALSLKKNIKPHSLHIVKPLGYLEFAYLTAHAKGIIIDSGSVAEEAIFNGVPYITPDSYTEHIETAKVGSNVLVGEDPKLLRSSSSDMVTGTWKKRGVPECWDGRPAERVVQILLERH